jgi:hypothetical protein
MSAMELHIDHLAVLVNIGHQLDVRNVYSEHSNLTQRLALDEERDRNYVLTELVCQMRTSVAYRYSEKAPFIAEVPEVHMVRIPLDTIADLAQALQWVRCYQYQSCEDPKWRSTFAHHYTNTLMQELITKIISAHNTSWTYNGPALT